jgi:hypothetical protein
MFLYIEQVNELIMSGDKMATAEEFIGLSKSKAQDVAEYKSLIFRLISIDGESFFGYPEDVRTDRICVEIEKGKVVVATIQ